MNQEKYGFVYIWYDRKHKRFYIGCHWGTEDDGYICSSPWMLQAYRIRSQDFKRRIIKTKIENRELTYIEEQKWLNKIKENEIKPFNEKPRYYNLHIKNNEVWHKYEKHIKNVGEKISKTKKSKPLSERYLKSRKTVGEAISKSKKGKKFTEEHKTALRGKKKPHTEEWKQQNSIRMKEQWSNGSRKRAKPKVTMTREEQDKLCSEQLKSRWADPIWAENQRKRLKESWDKRKNNINTFEITRTP